MPLRRRHSRALAAILLIPSGAACTILVAWAGALDAQLRERAPYRYVDFDPRESMPWPSWIPDAWKSWDSDVPVEHVAKGVDESISFCVLVRKRSDNLMELPPEWIRMPVHPTLVGQIAVQKSLCGFPFPALGMEAGRGPYFGSTSTFAPAPKLAGGLGPLRKGTPPVMLPVIPLLQGFFLDTLLYAPVTLILWRLGVLLRARLRIARNLCPVCGYTLAGLPAPAVCPECGGER